VRKQTHTHTHTHTRTHTRAHTHTHIQAPSQRASLPDPRDPATTAVALAMSDPSTASHIKAIITRCEQLTLPGICWQGQYGVWLRGAVLSQLMFHFVSLLNIMTHYEPFFLGETPKASFVYAPFVQHQVYTTLRPSSSSPLCWQWVGFGWNLLRYQAHRCMPHTNTQLNTAHHELLILVSA